MMDSSSYLNTEDHHDDDAKNEECRLQPLLSAVHSDFYTALLDDGEDEQSAARSSLTQRLGVRGYLQFVADFEHLFPHVLYQGMRKSIRKSDLDPPGDLALPFLVGKSWWFGGTHANG